MKLIYLRLSTVCTFLLLSGLSLTVAPQVRGQSGSVVASDAWVRVPAPSKTETALYMVLENKSSQARSVVSVTSDAAEKVEMHAMKTIKSGDSMSSGSGSTAGQNSSVGGGDNSMAKSDSSSMSMGQSDQSMMAMMPIKKIDIPAHGKTTLAPNGLHMMMFGLKERPAPGNKINVTLKLDDGTTVPVLATVRQ